MMFFRFTNLHLRQLRRERLAAQDALKDAKRRRDTRAIHAAQRAITAATHKVMRLEGNSG